MGISRDTFDKLKHYVGVRLQQGVPLVDADWNEQEDIRKYELQAFLKWFVGNGVPKGNDGFRIVSIVNKIILTSNKKDIGVSSVEVKLEDSTAAEALGFGPDNYRAKRVAPPAAQLTGKAGPFALVHNMTLAVSVDGLPPVTVTFSGDDFENISEATAAEVAEAINEAITDLTASPGEPNGFDIKGGDGTPEGAGRCLMEGWDAINESNLKYTAQPLFDNAALAAKWSVDPVQPLTTLTKNRIDTVYLDVWEREVDAEEDENLVNPAIGIETCVRLKREWAVRVAEGAPPPEPPHDHVFYPLATLRRKPGVAAIDKHNIKELRRSGLAVLSKELTIKDGNVGIGTTSPEHLLHLAGSAPVLRLSCPLNATEGTKIRFTERDFLGAYLHYDGKADRFEIGRHNKADSLLANDTPVISILRTNGNVGIGTTSPASTLDVNGTLKTTDLEVVNDNWAYLDIRSSAQGADAVIRLYDSADYWSIHNDDSAGNNLDIRFNNVSKMTVTPDGKVGIGTTTPDCGKIQIETGAVPLAFREKDQTGAGSLWRIPLDGKKLRFDVSQNGTDFDGYVTPLAMTSNGNVGIGTTNPASTLDVNGTLRTADDLRVEGTVTIDKSVYLAGSTVWNIRNIEGALQINSIQDTGEYTCLTIEPEGYFGIRKRRAAYELDVNGTAKISGDMIINNDTYITGNVGIGTTDPGNDKLYVRGRCYSSGGWYTTNADYAEYFESVNGLEIPVGTSVALTKDAKIGPAKKGDVLIGIITTSSAIVGNSYKEWPKKYLRDEFGNLMMEDYEEEVMVPKKEKVTKKRQKVENKSITEEVTRREISLENGKYIQKEISETITSEVEEPLFEEFDLYDATGKNVIGKHRIPVMETYEEEIEVLDQNGQPVLVGSGEFLTKQPPKLNPDYDESKKYVSREDRPEWNCVGLLGQLPMRKGQPVAESWIKVKDISDDVELWLVK